MKWTEKRLVDYLTTKSGCEASVDDIFDYFGVQMTNRNIANFRSCLKYMPTVEIRYCRQNSFLQTFCKVNPILVQEE